MKHFLVMGAVAMMAAISINAQTNLSGRVYHNPNIVTSVMEQEVDSKIVEERKKAIDKKEKEKGGKLTKKELADLDKAIADIKKKTMAAEKCISTAITIEFTSATDLVMKQQTKVDEKALKTIGVGWLKRKVLKTSLAVAPESQNAKYEVKNNKLIVIDGEDRDTLTIDNDGNTLSGILDKDTKYTLKRTK